MKRCKVLKENNRRPVTVAGLADARQGHPSIHQRQQTARCGNTAAQRTVPGGRRGYTFNAELTSAWQAKALLVFYGGGGVS